MIKGIVAGIAAAGIAVTAFALPAAASTASVTARPAHSAAWYDTHACRAFHTWLRRPTAKHLARLDRYASHADTFIKVDEGLLSKAVRHRKPRIVAVGWVEFDCATLNGYGL